MLKHSKSDNRHYFGTNLTFVYLFGHCDVLLTTRLYVTSGKKIDADDLEGYHTGLGRLVAQFRANLAFIPSEFATRPLWGGNVLTSSSGSHRESWPMTNIHTKCSSTLRGCSMRKLQIHRARMRGIWPENSPYFCRGSLLTFRHCRYSYGAKAFCLI